MYTGASCGGTWIGPRNQYVARGACSWEFRMFTSLAYGRLDSIEKSPLGVSDASTFWSPSGPPRDPLGTPSGPLWVCQMRALTVTPPGRRAKV
eukprot:1194926-Prorocentrum_minimum.AAC.2